jgi:hypothetical protein
MSQKWRFDPKWRIKIRFFGVTLRVSIIFSIFFLHSLGLSKTHTLWKKVFKKIQDGGWNEFFFGAAILDLKKKKLFFHKVCVLLTPNECKKKIEKIMDTLRVTPKNLILIRHFGSNRHF